MTTFSKRQGYVSAIAPITVQEDAPEQLRFYFVNMASNLGLSIEKQRDIICRILYLVPDLTKWMQSEIDSEVRRLLKRCEWYYVYDFIEACYRALAVDKRNLLSSVLNSFFVEHGIGWQLKDGEIAYRGDEIQ